jgi:hypothetical protein
MAMVGATKIENEAPIKLWDGDVRRLTGNK